MPSVKTAISLPEQVFTRTTRVAKRAGISRSELVRRALVTYLSREQADAVTGRINEHLDEHPLSADERDLIRTSGRDVARMLKNVKW